MTTLSGSWSDTLRSHHVDDEHKPISRRFIEGLVELAVVKHDNFSFAMVLHLVVHPTVNILHSMWQGNSDVQKKRNKCIDNLMKQEDLLCIQSLNEGGYLAPHDIPLIRAGTSHSVIAREC